MRIATWNVNSIRTRVERVIAFLEREQVDLLAMQEIKCKPDQFPREAFAEAGFEVAVHGLNQWNGVAFASRLPLFDVREAFPEQPEWNDVLEARALAATVESAHGPFTFWSLYVPNGREIDHPHYQYKLKWLERLRAEAASWLENDPDTLVAMGGDWNVAPRDEDVWDIDFFQGATHVTEPERQAFQSFASAGFREVTLPRVDGYTYWDYQQLRFPKNEGMRIDFVYGSPRFAELVTDVRIDRNERKGKGASDHVPVIVDWG